MLQASAEAVKGVAANALSRALASNCTQVQIASKHPFHKSQEIVASCGQERCANSAEDELESDGRAAWVWRCLRKFVTVTLTATAQS